MEASSDTAARPSRWRRLSRRFDAIFLFTVALPTLLAIGYYGFVASDVYISESRFVVRSPQRPNQAGLGALLQGTALSRAQDDTYSVHDFIRSRDALRELDAKLNLRAAYSATSIDFVNRFPGLAYWDASFEAFHRYYEKHVQVSYDSASSISVLRTYAYTASDAKRVNDLLLEVGERLVNQMNLRSRQDLINVAQEEVRLAEERSKSAALALSGFRSDRGVFDPDRQSTLQLQGVARLREELIAAQAQLEQMRQLSPDNPQLGAMRSRVESLQKSVASEDARVTGLQGGLVGKSAQFDRLALEKTFADRQLSGALAALDTARSEAVRKQLYLERLVQPNLPDKAVEPRRLRGIGVVFVFGLIAWGVISLIAAGVREHTE